MSTTNQQVPEPGPSSRLAVLGTGVMGETVLAGALRAGWSASDVVATVRRPERGQELRERHGTTTTSDNVEAVRGAGLVVVAVKPKDVAALLAEVSPHLGEGTVVVSVVVGLSTRFYEDRLPAGTAVVRVMPNTPSVIDRKSTRLNSSHWE